MVRRSDCRLSPIRIQVQQTTLYMDTLPTRRLPTPSLVRGRKRVVIHKFVVFELIDVILLEVQENAFQGEPIGLLRFDEPRSTLEAAHEMALGADYIQLQQALLKDVVVEVRHHFLVDQLNVVFSGMVRPKVLTV